MIILWGDIVTAVMLGLFVLRKGRDRSIGRSKPANWMMVAGLVALGLQATIHLITATGEVSDGNLNGAGHLACAVVVAIFGLLVWSRPLEVGAGVLVLAVLSLLYYGSGALYVTLPLLCAGLLFTVSGVLARGHTRRLSGETALPGQAHTREYHE